MSDKPSKQPPSSGKAPRDDIEETISPTCPDESSQLDSETSSDEKPPPLKISPGGPASVKIRAIEPTVRQVFDASNLKPSIELSDDGSGKPKSMLMALTPKISVRYPLPEGSIVRSNPDSNAHPGEADPPTTEVETPDLPSIKKDGIHLILESDDVVVLNGHRLPIGERDHLASSLKKLILAYPRNLTVTKLGDEKSPTDKYRKALKSCPEPLKTAIWGAPGQGTRIHITRLKELVIAKGWALDT
ncbi:MAG: hypothetical protein HQ519_07970 [Planctomycetes bacterium]|nr:hypothetical protein [Planctomycetota bacterium]